MYKNNLLKQPGELKRPLSVYLRTGATFFCDNCGSTKPRTGFLRLFGKRKCDNPNCNG